MTKIFAKILALISIAFAQSAFGGAVSESPIAVAANFQAAKAEYDSSSHDEATCVRYVTKLADIYYQLLQNDWATGEKRAMEDGDRVLEELAKYPAPANSDSKELSRLLVGEWASVRHANPYVFRADGKWGRSGGLADDSWRIERNQYFARDATGTIDESGTIILLNNDYFIHSDRSHSVTFYARFQKALEDSQRVQKQADAPPQQTSPGNALPSAPEFQAAQQEYEQSSHDESARSAYVIKLARIRERQIQKYWKTGDPNYDSATATNEELRKHPAPADSDSKKLSQFLVGRWQSPRRIYVFRANGKWGSEDGPVNGNWRITGNQLVEDGSHRTIILLNPDYFIYSDGSSVFFHSRVKE